MFIPRFVPRDQIFEGSARILDYNSPLLSSLFLKKDFNIALDLWNGWKRIVK